jgi:chromosome segregation ATPase
MAEHRPHYSESVAADETMQELQDRAARLREVIDALYAQVDQHRTEATAQQGTIESLLATLEQQEAALARESAAVAALQEEIDRFKHLGPDADAVAGEVASLRKALKTAQRTVWVMQHSSSWRWTALLRTLIRKVGGNTTESILEGPE